MKVSDVVIRLSHISRFRPKRSVILDWPIRAHVSVGAVATNLSIIVAAILKTRNPKRTGSGGRRFRQSVA
jgi:hypothetical protein